MLILGNTISGKIAVWALSIIYKLDYKHANLFRKQYVFTSGIFKKMRRFLAYGTIDMFDAICIETTTRCNKRCWYCPNSIFDRGLEENEKLMPVGLFKKIIDELKVIEFKGRISPHLYGEPLLDNRLVQLMRYVQETLPNSKVTIYTNGDFLDVEMLESLSQAGVSSYFVTIHGDLKNGTEKMRNLIRYIKKNNKKIDILCQHITADTPLLNRSGLIKAKNISQELLCVDELMVNYKGDVVICCNDYSGEVVFGNLRNETLAEIWDKNIFKVLRRQLKNREYTLDICRRCVGL